MGKRKKGKLRIGTSNIVVPGNKQSFPTEYQQRSRLRYYASLFNTLEVNSTFYKVPMPATFEKWSMDVPDDFQFTIKLWKEVTHVKELKFDPDNIDHFLNAAARTGKKKGCLLIQFPGKINLDYYNLVEEILQRVDDHDEQDKWRIAVEFRNASWYVNETKELLDEYGASLVLHDIPKGKNFDINKKASFVYIRYHGPTGNYRGSYSDEYLKEQNLAIQRWLKEGKDVYAYFNNTMGIAFDNARTLMAMSNGGDSL
jgi:uncharacterized protein YecE (DUF72 family)